MKKDTSIGPIGSRNCMAAGPGSAIYRTPYGYGSERALFGLPYYQSHPLGSYIQ